MTPRTAPSREALLRKHLARGNRLRFRAHGNSMYPAIRHGDLVHVATGARAAAGDVLLYARGEAWFVHRLVRVERSRHEPTRCTLRGDAFAEADAPIPTSRVLAKVIRVERDGDEVPRRRWSPPWMGAVVQLPGSPLAHWGWLHRRCSRLHRAVTRRWAVPLRRT